jgi:uncharacterized protein (DUF1800 family)
MKQKLQHWVFILICGSMLWLGLGCQQQASGEVEQPRIRHVLERLSFGVTPEQMQQVEATGIEAYIQSQLSPESIQEPAKLKNSLAQLDLIQADPIELSKKYYLGQRRINKNSEISNETKNKLQKQNQKQNQKIRLQAVESRLLRAINSPRQLQEVMVDFWFNHFNVFALKKSTNLWLADYEQKIRTHALGNFRDLLAVTAHHPAMLIYLDNELNTDPNSSVAKGQFKGLNENYARELMELHTLGVDGGYTQADVVALARILTGWSVDHFDKQENENGFFFFENRHDSGDKIFLGQKIPSSGIEEGEQALDILAAHPATAHFISYKLAQYFVADEPPSTLVDLLAKKFLESDGNIKVVLNTLIHSQEFNSSEYYAKKFKTPYQYIVSLVRTGGIKNPNFKRMQGMIAQLGMPTYLCATPNGYKNSQDAWLNPDGMLRRVGFATAIANGSLNKEYSLDADKLRHNLGDLSPKTQQVIAKNPPGLSNALMLGSPEAMYR